MSASLPENEAVNQPHHAHGLSRWFILMLYLQLRGVNFRTTRRMKF
jgi:hypothetical protein